MPKKPLYIQLEPGAYPKDSDWQMMTSGERGCYHSLIIFIACNDGSLPNETQRLAVLCNIPVKEFENFWKKYSHKFIVKTETIQHKRISEELAKARKYITQKSLAGKRGMQRRYNTDTTPLKQSNNSDITKGSKEKGREVKKREEVEEESLQTVIDNIPTSVSAINFTEQQFTQIVTNWNKTGKQKANPDPATQIMIVKLLDRVDSIMTVDKIVEAIGNLATLTKWPHEWNLTGFLKNKNIENYVYPNWNPQDYTFLAPEKKKFRTTQDIMDGTNR